MLIHSDWLRVSTELRILTLLLLRSSPLDLSSSQGADRRPQPPTRFIVGGPGEDQSVATLDPPRPA
jgi:hypothetical protein